MLDRRLEGHEFVAGDYSIADMAIFPWTRGHEGQNQKIDDFPNVKRWLAAIEARPAVQRGLAVLTESRRTGPISASEREVMFGKTQYERR